MNIWEKMKLNEWIKKWNEWKQEKCVEKCFLRRRKKMFIYLKKKNELRFINEEFKFYFKHCFNILGSAVCCNYEPLPGNEYIVGQFAVVFNILRQKFLINMSMVVIRFVSLHFIAPTDIFIVTGFMLLFLFPTNTSIQFGAWILITTNTNVCYMPCLPFFRCFRL